MSKMKRQIWPMTPLFGIALDSQVEIDAHYSGYLKRQSHDIVQAFKKDENIKNLLNILIMTPLSGLSNEIKSKLKKNQAKNFRASSWD